MNFFYKIFDKLYLKQWSIGVSNHDISDIIRRRATDLNFKWTLIDNKNKFYADPFLFVSGIKEYSILFEDYDYTDQYGKISLGFLDKDLKIINSKVILDIKSHLSYPNIFIENGQIYVFPEACKSGKLSGYQYDQKSKSLIFKGDIINLPLVDATILKFENKYWIFCTIDGKYANRKLFVYHSESLWGPYVPHKQNPVKCDITGSRPAGNFIEVDGHLYRPAQNSGKYYGSSICINKVIHLSENEFREEAYMTIKPNKSDYYNFGMHTINYVHNMVVVDGLVRRFLPLTQIRTFVQKHLNKI